METWSFVLGSFIPSSFSLFISSSFILSLLLAQVDVQNTANNQQGHGEPGQDEAVTKVRGAGLPGLIQDLLAVEREDETGSKVCQPWEAKNKSKEELNAC